MAKWVYRRGDIEAEYNWGSIEISYKGWLLERIGTNADTYDEFVRDVERHINSWSFRSKIDDLESSNDDDNDRGKKKSGGGWFW